ncbi:hypothetical protein FB440_13214 [Vibrio crassostreae]|uniref:Uncharacterized protein n=1 Tax=Vibrio crassostreae TaxID=246167 RepID=A0A0T7DCC4_9VIBR|nr:MULTISPECIES: hypothetical protein [Vibrio]MCG9542475.1 hypothetical protein [Vibrio sp. Isolate33]MDH5948797.1 hypothetical protein [Vibrio crassostreae]ROO54243.1 hypothetical protein EDB56_104248 [Vibrio crassostreae]ROO65280.1 hypothetical protein EDB58_10163 [Vibrio crassostreae]ROO69285.1 hypothetical protein EDB57_2953 [Vibrio crassostreae]
MNIVLSNKILVLISSLSLAAGILALKFGFEGLFPIFVVVISFFSVVINLYLLCISREEKDVSDSYQ